MSNVVIVYCVSLVFMRYHMLKSLFMRDVFKHSLCIFNIYSARKQSAVSVRVGTQSTNTNTLHMDLLHI